MTAYHADRRHNQMEPLITERQQEFVEQGGEQVFRVDPRTLQPLTPFHGTLASLC